MADIAYWPATPRIKSMRPAIAKRLDNPSLNNDSSIQFSDQENIITDLKSKKKHKYPSNTTTRAKIKLLPVFGRYLEFLGKGITGKVSMATVKKFTPENMG